VRSPVPRRNELDNVVGDDGEKTAEEALLVPSRRRAAAAVAVAPMDAPTTTTTAAKAAMTNTETIRFRMGLLVAVRSLSIRQGIIVGNRMKNSLFFHGGENTVSAQRNQSIEIAFSPNL
jgi:hypothetical protein